MVSYHQRLINITYSSGALLWCIKCYAWKIIIQVLKSYTEFMNTYSLLNGRFHSFKTWMVLYHHHVNLKCHPELCKFLKSTKCNFIFLKTKTEESPWWAWWYVYLPMRKKIVTVSSLWARRELTVTTMVMAPGPMITAQSRLGEVTAQSWRGHSSVTARSQLSHGEVTAQSRHLPHDHGLVALRSQLNHGPGHGSVTAACDHFACELTVSSHGGQFFSHGLHGLYSFDK